MVFLGADFVLGAAFFAAVVVVFFFFVDEGFFVVTIHSIVYERVYAINPLMVQ